MGIWWLLYDNTSYILAGDTWFFSKHTWMVKMTYSLSFSCDYKVLYHFLISFLQLFVHCYACVHMLSFNYNCSAYLYFTVLIRLVNSNCLYTELGSSHIITTYLSKLCAYKFLQLAIDSNHSMVLLNMAMSPCSYS